MRGRRAEVLFAPARGVRGELVDGPHREGVFGAGAQPHWPVAQPLHHVGSDAHPSVIQTGRHGGHDPDQRLIDGGKQREVGAERSPDHPDGVRAH